MCGWCVDINICKSQGLDSVRSKRKMSLVDVMSEEQCSTDHVKVLFVSFLTIWILIYVSV